MWKNLKHGGDGNIRKMALVRMLKESTEGSWTDSLWQDYHIVSLVCKWYMQLFESDFFLWFCSVLKFFFYNLKSNKCLFLVSTTFYLLNHLQTIIFKPLNCVQTIWGCGLIESMVYLCHQLCNGYFAALHSFQFVSK